MPKTVAVFGATGAQGAPVVTEALAQGYTVRAVARDLSKIRDMHPAAQAYCADLNDKDGLVNALRGVEAAFLHLPIPTAPTDIETWMGAFLGAAHEVSLPLLVFATGGPTGDRFPASTIVDGSTQGMNALLSSGIPTIVLQSAVYLENLLPALFVPALRSEGTLDYPPVGETLRFQWTSHQDQARVAVAAFARPELAGQAYEIGTPDALTGHELADILSRWLDREVTFQPMTPEAFGQRVGDTLGNPGVAFALADLYGSIAQLNGDAMAIDTKKVEDLFGVELTRIEDHIARWPKG